jgi:hypothetical protein
MSKFVITSDEIKDIHNGICRLRNVISRLEDALSHHTINELRKSMSEIETTTFESVLSRIAGTISTGIDETTTVIFKKRLNTGWRKNTFKTEPGLTEGTTAAAEVELAGATREEVATMPVNTALLTRVSGSAKSIEDCK